MRIVPAPDTPCQAGYLPVNFHGFLPARLHGKVDGFLAALFFIPVQSLILARHIFPRQYRLNIIFYPSIVVYTRDFRHKKSLIDKWSWQ
jgi:hypothetical protein